MHRRFPIRTLVTAILALGLGLAVRASESQGAPAQGAPRPAPAQPAPAQGGPRPAPAQGGPRPAPAPPAQPAPRPADKAGSTPEELDAARAAFGDVARVLLSPRCRNCHPAGDAPLHGDAGTPHSMNVSRRSAEAGLACTACHRERNSAIPGAPPGAPSWHMPDRETPMTFEGHTPASLCEQLKDPAATGGRDLVDLVVHVEDDPFVRWAWQPGPGRSTPPVAHADLVAAMARWAAAGGPCPAE